MQFLPIFLDLTSGNVVLVGTGAHAVNKLRLLRAAKANVRWFTGGADVAEEIIQAANGPGRLEVAVQDPLDADLTGTLAVVCAVGGPIDAQIAARARGAGIPVNVVDRPDLSTFIMPAVVDRGEVVVAIGTGGASPVLARRLRERIETILPARIGDLAGLIGRYRHKFAAVKSALSPREFWQRVIDGPIGNAVLAGRTAEAEAALVRDIDAAGRHQSGVNINTIFLVGAGPGDPDLLTVRALQCLQDADLIFYDELVTEAILDRARRDAGRIFVGKRRGEPGVGQDEINRRLLDTARTGKRVVRLKGGDPFIFGRGGEELEFLRLAGVPVVVVPGITAALGCAAEAGLPLTFRKEAARLTFITAHRADDAHAIDWTGLAGEDTTLVVYMGHATAGAVHDGLINAGRAPSTPAAVIARGTRPDSQSAVGRLDELPSLAASVGEGPALLVIGDVVRHSAPWHAVELAATVERIGQAA